MKKAIILSAATFFAISTYAQVKGGKDQYKKVDTIPSTQVVRQYALILDEQEWNRLTMVISTNGKLTGANVSDYITFLQGRIIPLPVSSDSTKQKK